MDDEVAAVLPTTAATAAAATAEDKIKVQFKAVGGAPLLKKTKV